MEAPGLYPLKSNTCFLLASPVHGTKYDETAQGEKWGAWFRAGCAGRWSHGYDGAKRLCVSQCYEEHTATVAYCNASRNGCLFVVALNHTQALVCESMLSQRSSRVLALQL